MKTVLYVDDSEEDAILLEKAIRRANLPVRLVRVLNGTEAIKYIDGSELDADRDPAPLPHLVLLDIKMPVLTGFDVLKWVRAKEPYRRLSVFMLSSSNLEEDIARARMLGADGYFVKTPSFQEVIDGMRAKLDPETDGLRSHEQSYGFGSLRLSTTDHSLV